MQSAVYGTAFFNGTVQSMGSTIVALLVVALIDKNLALLIGIILASRQFLTVTLSVYAGSLMDNFGTKRVIIAFGFVGGGSLGRWQARGPRLQRAAQAPTPREDHGRRATAIFCTI